jgi:hypothetical protein
MAASDVTDISALATVGTFIIPPVFAVRGVPADAVGISEHAPQIGPTVTGVGVPFRSRPSTSRRCSPVRGVQLAASMQPASSRRALPYGLNQLDTVDRSLSDRCCCSEIMSHRR